VDESGVIPSRHSRHHGPPCSRITRGMNNRPVGGRSSETQSHPVIINQSNHYTTEATSNISEAVFVFTVRPNVSFPETIFISFIIIAYSENC
jgi:hypothetical protein